MIETTPHPLPEETVPVAGDEVAPASAYPEGAPRQLGWLQVALVLVVCAGALMALVAPALLALTAPYALWARGGLETMWYATLLLFSVLMTVLGLGGRVWAYPLAAIGLFALALTRHDGAIPLALSGLFVLISLWR